MLPIDGQYFDWLYDQVGSVPHVRPSKTYMRLLEQLFFKEFVWIIPNDDNRAEDGRDLRHVFLEECRIKNVDPEWISLGCCLLELFIGISRRLSFEAGGEAIDWFWVLIKNLGLDKYTDDRPLPKDEVNEILDDMIWRTYEPDGRGGLFPLQEANEDQRDVEIWYQLNAYLLERVA